MRTIALLGAPGAGKSRLAHAVADELVRRDGQCDDCNTPITIVDNYSTVVRDRGQYEIGLNGGYMASIGIAVERYNQERAAGYDGCKTLISCGTVVESSVYLAQHFERTLALKTTDEARMEEAQRIEGTVKMLAVLYMDTFKYEKAFYLPPLQPNEDERWATFDRNLQAAFSAYNVPVAPLLIEEYEDEDDLVRQQVEKVLE